MRKLSVTTYGADTISLTHIYHALIRCKCDYGVAIDSSAIKTEHNSTVHSDLQQDYTLQQSPRYVSVDFVENLQHGNSSKECQIHEVCLSQFLNPYQRTDYILTSNLQIVIQLTLTQQNYEQRTRHPQKKSLKRMETAMAMSTDQLTAPITIRHTNILYYAQSYSSQITDKAHSPYTYPPD